jgi:hypothetical protein
VGRGRHVLYWWRGVILMTFGGMIRRLDGEMIELEKSGQIVLFVDYCRGGFGSCYGGGKQQAGHVLCSAHRWGLHGDGVRVSAEGVKGQ